MGGRGAYSKIKSVSFTTKKSVVKKKIETASDKIRGVFDEINKNGFSKAQPFSIGLVEERMIDFSKENGIDIPSKKIFISSKSISHSVRHSKSAKELSVSQKDIINFPQKRRKMDLYYDGKGFIYTDYKTKYIINHNYEIKIKGKKSNRVCFITAGRVTDANEFKLKKYTKI